MNTKRSRLTVALAAFVAFVALAAIPAAAATSGSILLSGSVPAILEITVTPEPGIGNLPITTTQSDLLVATVVERSNKHAGYTVTLQSSNMVAGGLASPTFESADTSDSLPYSIKYGGVPVSFSSGTAVVSDVAGRTDAAGSSKSVTISFDGANYFLDEATYSDTLTLTIIAK